jgi:KDO2-lipid IV(A) lauroyltransferase
VSGAPLVPVFTRRLGYMDYDVHVSEPVRLPRRPAPADLDAASSAVLRAMEAFVRANPTQWFHFE